MSQAEFDQAAKDVKNLPKEPDQADMLKLYGYFKQANVGDVNTTRPGALDFTGKYKWDAWNKVKGTNKEDARKQYIELVRSLEAKHKA